MSVETPNATIKITFLDQAGHVCERTHQVIAGNWEGLARLAVEIESKMFGQCEEVKRVEMYFWHEEKCPSCLRPR